MSEESKVVDGSQVATPVGVEASSNTAPVDDPEVRLAALREQLSNVTRDRDNYRAATLAMKGKTEVEELDITDPVQLSAYINKTVEDRLLATRQSQIETDLQKHADELARKNKELTLALANRSSIPAGAGSGSGTQAKMESTDSSAYWSPEQVAALKARGLTDAQIKTAADHARRAGA
jgi:hypothetical protein